MAAIESASEKTAGKKTPLCNLCEEGPALHFCMHCCEYYCMNCSRAHGKSKASFRHKQVEVEDLTEEMLRAATSHAETAICVKHEMKFNLYCSTCQCPVCPACCHVNHQSHTIREITCVDAKSELKDTIGVLKGLIEGINSQREMLNGVETSLNSNTSSATATVQEAFQNIHQMVDNLANDCIQVINKASQSTGTVIATRASSLTLEADRLNRSLRLVEGLMEKDSPFDRLAKLSEVRSQLEQFQCASSREAAASALITAPSKTELVVTSLDNIRLRRHIELVDGAEPQTGSRLEITLTCGIIDQEKLGQGGWPGFGSWGRGSSGGVKSSSQEKPPPSAPANSFSALSGGGCSRADSKYGRNRRMLGQGGPPGQGDDGWQAVGGRQRRTIREVADPQKMKVTTHTMDDNIQLGAGGWLGFSVWGRGSSGGVKSSSQEKPPPSAPANRFSALYGSGGGADSNYDRNRSMGRGGMSGGRQDSKPSRLGAPAGAGRGKTMSRLSQEQDREAALSAARHLAGPTPNSRTTPVGSRNSRTRDGSRNRDAEKPAAKELSPEVFERKTKSLIDEYLSIHDLKELAIECVKDLGSPKNIHMFVSKALEHVLERSDQARKMTGQLMHDLVKRGVLTVDQYLMGTKEILEFAKDMAIDIPKIWQYLAQLISPMIQDGSVPLDFLKQACEPVFPSGKAGKLVAEILTDASHRLGHAKVRELWRNSGLLWTDFLSPRENVQEFVKDNKMEFTVGPEEPKSPVAKMIPVEIIQRELDYLLVKGKSANDVVFDWIDANVDEKRTTEAPFIRALMTSVCSSAISEVGDKYKVDSDVIKGRLPLLQRYLDHKAEHELQALYALQALVHKLEHPSDVLRTFFDTLYDEDIISDDAFNQWDQNDDPAEAGKGVARSSVVQFFNWLRVAEEESQDDS